MNRYRHYAAALLAASPALLFAGVAKAGSWTDSAPFGATLQGDLYTPTTPAASPAILVVIHMCSGHSSTVHGWFDSYADTNGFYLIAPSSGSNDCFDSSASRSGDRAAIVTMVNYVLTNKHANPQRVFAAGMSSGGCMTNTLVAIYPDVFSGGAAMPGFPAGGWPAGDTTCTKCGTMPMNPTNGTYWANFVTTANPGFKGEYGCLEEWVGGGDQYDFNDWIPAVAAQWQTLADLGAGAPGTGAPSGWTREVYKDQNGNIRLETNIGPSSQKHDLETVMPPLYGPVVTYLGLDKPTGGCGLATTSVQDNQSDGGMSGGSGASGTSEGDASTSGSSGGSTSGSTSGTRGTTGSSGTGTSGTATGNSGTSGTGTGSSGNASSGTTAGSSGSGTGSGNSGSGSTGSGNSGSGSGSNASGSTNSGSDDNGGGGSKSSGCSMISGGPAGAGTGVMFAAGLLGLAFGGRRRRRS
ncbi:MAG TPA: PHB depolymerase family esterase [Polyangiaceae bacterium]|nr:PHB depolymerase family esterase [Polyangiaceae bacterium]